MDKICGVVIDCGVFFQKPPSGDPKIEAKMNPDFGCVFVKRLVVNSWCPKARYAEGFSSAAARGVGKKKNQLVSLGEMERNEGNIRKPKYQVEFQVEFQNSPYLDHSFFFQEPTGPRVCEEYMCLCGFNHHL